MYVAELMWIFCARIQNRALEGSDSPVPGEHTLVLLLYQPTVSTSSLENVRLRKKYKEGEDAQMEDEDCFVSVTLHADVG